MEHGVGNPGELHSYMSGGGSTARVDLQDEDYIIIRRDKEGKDFSSIDVSFRSHIIRIYDDRPWKINSMNKDSQHLDPILITKE